MSSTLILSKFNPPKKYDSYMFRKALMPYSDVVRDIPLTVVSGPAASGKTSLIINQFDFDTDQDIWVNCDESFNDFEVFWRYFVAAFNAENRELYTMNERHWKEDINRIVNMLNDHDSMMLVLDDFHHINNASILSSFNMLLDNVQDHIVFVISSRHNVSLNNASRLMKRRMQIISQELLMLSEKEAHAYLKLNSNVSKEVKGKIISQSEGWFGALYLLSLNQSTTQEEVIDSDYLKTFIIEEVLKSYDVKDQEVILKLAHLPFFNDEVIEVIDSKTSGVSLIDTMITKKMMLQRLDENNSYRFHHLLQETFKEHQDIDSTSLSLVANYYADLGFISEALYLYELNMNSMMIMFLLLEYPNVPEYFYYLKNVDVKDSMLVFEIAYQKFFYHYSILDFDVCKEMHHEALHHIEEDIRFESFKGMEAIFNPSSVQPSFKPLDVKYTSDFTAILMYLRNAIAFSYEDRYHQANEDLFKALKLVDEVENFYDISYLYNGIGQNYEELGYLNDAFLICDRAESFITENRHDYVKVINTVSKTGLCLKSMDLKSADELMNEALDRSQAKIANVNQSVSYNRIEWLYLMMNDTEAYQELLKFLPIDKTENLLMYGQLLKYPLARNQLDNSLKQRFIESYTKHDGYISLDSRMAYVQCINEFSIQEKIIDGCLIHAKKERIYLKIVELDLLKIRLFEHHYDKRSKINLFKEALSFASEHKIKSPFVMERDVLKRLVIRHSDEIAKALDFLTKTFYDEILILLNVVEQIQLSERETEVLLCIRDGLSNVDIGETLFISLSTVKTHINNIFNKLDVRTRVAAVTKAQDLGII